jgi:hypothetical protein
LLDKMKLPKEPEVHQGTRSMPNAQVAAHKSSLQSSVMADAVQRVHSAVTLLTPTHVLALQRTVGNRAVQQLLRSARARSAPPSFAPSSSPRPEAIQRKVEGNTPLVMSRIQTQVIQPARYLMNFELFKQRKAAATTRKSLGRTRSTSDVKKIYKNYDAYVRKKRYAQAQAELVKLDNKLKRMSNKTYWTSTTARDALINDMRTGLQQEQRWLAHEMGAATGAPQQLGRPVDGIIPKMNRPTAELTMGQGVAVDLGQMILFSDEFSSCSPIVLFNATTRIGSLFHFPANRLEAQRGNLQAMYNHVQPTHIYLNDRSAFFPGQTDYADLRNFFQNDLGFAGEFRDIPKAWRNYAVTLGDDGEVEIAGMIDSRGPYLSATRDRTGDERIGIEEKWQNAPSATKFGRDDWHDD